MWKEADDSLSMKVGDRHGCVSQCGHGKYLRRVYWVMRCGRPRRVCCKKLKSSAERGAPARNAFIPGGVYICGTTSDHECPSCYAMFPRGENYAPEIT